jgi:hypothetical protein
MLSGDSASESRDRGGSAHGGFPGSGSAGDADQLLVDELVGAETAELAAEA